MDYKRFHIVDYIVFVISLLIPLAIGIFFHIYNKRKQTTSEYLLGGRQMGCLVLGFSLMASFFNAIYLLGAPAETYYFGTVWNLLILPAIVNYFIKGIFFVPFFRRSSSSSGYEYLEKRYKSKIPRLVAAFGFSLLMISFLAVVMYAPALAFNQVSGLNMNIAIASCGIICTLYTYLGGIRAVLWTDAAQTITILVSFAIICFAGIANVGGWYNFTTKVSAGGRINYLNFDTDPKTRHTFLTQVIGGFFINLSASNQITIQRYKAAKSLKAARMSLVVNAISSIGMTLLCSCVGLILYAHFADCDPLVAGITKKKDQILPLFVMEVFGKYPGLPGSFIAAIFAAALSTVSSIINSMTLVTLEDFIKPLHLAMRGTQLQHPLFVTKSLTAIYGILSIALAFAAPHMGPLLLQIPAMLRSSFGAPMNVLFAVSIFWPYNNVWGATGGSMLGLCFGFFLSMAKTLYRPRQPTLPLGQCVSLEYNASDTLTNTFTQANLNFTEPMEYTPTNDGIMEYFGEMSYMWYPLLNWTVTLSSCIIISAIARLLRLPKTDNSHIYREGLVYYKYTGGESSVYKHEAQPDDHVELKHFIMKDEKS